MNTNLTKGILEELEKRSDGLRRAELRRLVGASSKNEMREFNQAIRQLSQEGRLIARGRGRLGLPQDADSTVGVLSVHPRGFGFVSREGELPDIFIPPSKMGNAFPGDRVKVLLAEETEKGPAGIIEDVVERGYTSLTGEFADNGPTPVLRPMRRDFPEEISLRLPNEPADGESPLDGDWIVADLVFPEHPKQKLEAVFRQKLNQGMSLTEDVDAIIAEFALPAPYTQAQQLAAAKLQPREIDRCDCRELTAITIDPIDAKDFDDAISIETTDDEDRVRVGVHIADVAAYVAAGDELDAEARRRGFTAYLPGRTLPMLPKPLAADLCSLREGQLRPAHSVFLTISKTSGKVLARERLHTTLKVRKRLAFGDVQQALEGDIPDDWPPDVATSVGELGRLAETMRRQRRAQEVFLELATTEIRVVYEDEPPAIVGFQESRPNPSHELVEEFMLAANVAVAEELLEKKLPGIFRIHDTPKEKDMGEFREWARNAMHLKPGRLESRSTVNDFLRSVAGDRAEQIVIYAFLRTLPRAVYAAACGDHFGLGKSRYCHFTSPIRRYADLTVHQQLWLNDTGAEPLSAEECELRAKETTAIEAVNDEAYFAALDRVKIRFLNQRRAAGEKVVFEAVVSKATVDGLLLFLPELGMMGFAPKELLGDDSYVYSARNFTLRGRHGRHVYRCGDPLRVRPHKADVARGQLVLKPV